MSDQKELKGGHVAAIFGGAFTIIIAVNLVLATQAVRTFPGLEVKNSYVASQSFERKRAAQVALGWETAATISEGRLSLTIADAAGPVLAEIVSAQLGRATHVADDRPLEFTYQNGSFVADVKDLAPGIWELRLEAKSADGTAFRQRLELYVRP